MAPVFDRVVFRGSSFGLVKNLPGFARHHRLPDAGSPTAIAFVRQIGAELVAQRSLELFRQLRQAFTYRRRDLTVSEEAGMADLLTPDFTVHLSLDLDPEDPRRYVLAIEVDQVTHSEALYSEAFRQVFEDCFDRVVCVVNRRISIEDVIDRVEDHPSPETVSVDYPPDASHCVVVLTGMRAQLQVEPQAITLLARPQATIAELLEVGEKLPGLLGLDPAAPLFQSSLGT